MPKIEKTSASAIKTFDECQLKWYKVYIEKIPDVEPHPLTLVGSCLHRMMEKATKARLAKVTTQEQDPLYFKLDSMKEYGVKREYSPLLDDLVSNAVEWGYFRNIMNTVGCEVEVIFYLPNKVRVRGFIDRLDVKAPNADIIDLKTQKHEFSRGDLDHNWQAKIYNIGTRTLHPEVTGKANVSFWVLRHMVQRICMTAEDAKMDMDLLVKKTEEMMACENPKTTETALCEYCPHVGCTARDKKILSRHRCNMVNGSKER